MAGVGWTLDDEEKKSHENKNVIVVANVGSRDVRYRDETIEPARSRGKELLERFEETGPELSFPIIIPALEYILKYEGGIGLLLLCYTDQEPETAGSHRESDTVHFARLIKKGFDSNVKALSGIKRPARVDIRKIDCNPSQYDACFDFYRKSFQHLAEKYFQPSQTRCYVLPVGGTPACATGLLLASIAVYRGNALQVYVPPGGCALEVSFGKKVLQEYLAERADSLLQSYQFHALSEMFTSDGLDDLICMCVASSAAARLQFDFEAARSALRPVEQTPDTRGKDYLPCLINDLDKLMNKERVIGEQLKELYWQMKLKLECGELGDFLSRWYRFSEATIIHACRTLADFADAEKPFFPENNLVSKYSQVCSRIKEKNDIGWTLPPLRETQGGTIDLNRAGIIRNVAFLDAFRDACKDSRKQRMIAEFLDAWATLWPIQRKRNKSFIAHGFKGLSSKELADVLKVDKDGLVDFINGKNKKMLNSIDIELGDVNPFDCYAKYIRERLDSVH